VYALLIIFVYIITDYFFYELLIIRVCITNYSCLYYTLSLYVLLIIHVCITNYLCIYYYWLLFYELIIFRVCITNYSWKQVEQYLKKTCVFVPATTRQLFFEIYKRDFYRSGSMVFWKHNVNFDSEEVICLYNI
jgi:hypothetical protein